MLTLATVGGLLLIVGAYFVLQGQIFRSVTTYFIADIIWISMAVESGDTQGALLISLGALLGFAAFLKMNSGKMRKTLLWDGN